ncbi:prepilin-type N-terminal cleavage/methylation domain-containing protein [Xenorhabdus bovienii]|uniref:prepilin-type N-terminal cleavage/methylation domain-containing protein n=1 Tax=Xenorhabdus bovienii TaxID=40576 RepID=UPI00237C5434|nr:prepilin-type N-terminal cleavage/methylation domain-containing protein [Xenorhabdus bovienii]MDE1472988.1 prepilin-type N-terminal cleavage/methylation domain-containing protein [Xenorhabdus bovienii]
MKRFHLHRHERQNGMSLPEVMLASVVFVISLLGLMRYHQALSSNFQQYWLQLKAVRLAHDQLEQYERLEGQIVLEETESQQGWKIELQREFRSLGCYQITVNVTKSYNQSNKLDRWFCASGSIDV